MTAMIAERAGLEFGDVAEIIELKSSRMVNSYLEAGYRLIAVSGMSRMMPQRGQEMPHVRRWAQYTLGRPVGVDHVEIPYPARWEAHADLPVDAGGVA